MRELAGYAVHPGASKGRAIREPAPSGRTEFQRDRDRIVHSSAFRRLEYKTQVFVNHEGDHFRTRLTHSIEVAQIARSIARSLKLNEDLVEAIALAHDLGHTPFGHAGQDALNECMRNSGGFEHNLQSLRVVDLLEQRYAAFDGLNLCYETREGILKHCSLPHARELGELGQRFLKKTQPSLEAQIANIADEIAYNNHDVDDGLRSGLISIEQLESVFIFKRHVAMVKGMYPGLEPRRLIHETVRRMISTLIGDLVNTTQRAIDTAGVARVEDVRAGPSLVTLSPSMQEEQQELKRFLHGNLYRHAHVNRMSAEAKRVVAQLFQAFSSSPALLPAEYRARHQRDGPRAIADYVAGMTDRYAMSEHRRLSGANVDKVPD